MNLPFFHQTATGNATQLGTIGTIPMSMFAAIVGILASIGALLFRKLIAVLHNLLFLGQFSFFYNENSHTPMSIWGIGIILVPTLASLIVMGLIEKFASDQKGLSVPAVMYAVFYKDGKIKTSVALAKIVASAITIGSGGSVGREGPVFQIGATLSSIISDFTNLSPCERKILIAAGICACTSAIFHAPISGIFFAIEILLIPLTFFPIFLLIISTVLASITTYLLSDFSPIFSIYKITQLMPMMKLETIIFTLCLGICIGLLATIFIKGIYLFEDSLNIAIKNSYLRHFGSMFIVGLMLYTTSRLFGHYYIEGIGFATIQDCLSDQLTDSSLLLILVLGKLVATCLTLGSGASGGVFSPALFMGATLGNAFGIILNYYIPTLGIHPVVFTILGMSAMLGSTTGALLTSIILVTEMIQNLHFTFPIIIIVIIAYVTRRCLCRDNVYTLKLRRNGVNFYRQFYN